jgi:ABC-type polysaccharide/polyol phosphate export permease
VCSEYTPILKDLLGLPKTPFNVLMLLGIPWNKAKNKSVLSTKYMSFFVKNGNEFNKTNINVVQCIHNKNTAQVTTSFLASLLTFTVFVNNK